MDSRLKSSLGWKTGSYSRLRRDSRTLPSLMTGTGKSESNKDAQFSATFNECSAWSSALRRHECFVSVVCLHLELRSSLMAATKNNAHNEISGIES